MSEPDLTDEEAVARLRENERRVWRRFPLVLALTLPVIPLSIFAVVGLKIHSPLAMNLIMGATILWMFAITFIFLWPRDRRALAAFKRPSVRLRMLDDIQRTRRFAYMVQMFVLAVVAAQAGYAMHRLGRDSGFIHGVHIFQIGLFLVSAILYPAILSLLVKRPLPSGAPDELTASLGGKALRVGYLAALPLLIGLAGVAFLAPASLWWAAPTLIWLAASAPLLAFVILDLRAGQEG